ARPDRGPLAAVLNRLRHRAPEWTASAQSGPPPWSSAGWHRASIAMSVGAARVAIGGVGGGWAPGGSSGARTGPSPPRAGTGERARRVRIPVATTASGQGGAVEVDQAGDPALRWIVHPLVVHENVHLVEQERARDLVRGDPVRLLDQGLALVRIGLQALLLDQLVDPGVGEHAERVLVLVAHAPVELGRGLHPVDQAVVGVVVAARAQAHHVEVQTVERV